MSSADRAALVALFRSTGGTRWTRRGNWNTGADLSQWYGVEVNRDGRVVELRLFNNNLEAGVAQEEGAIPKAVGALAELKKLHLSINKLRGPISEALGALKKLTYLNLGRNKLTGSIPAWLGSLRKLQTLGLYSNQLTGPIPEALGALKALTILWLNDNKITGSIPTWLGSLSKLRVLELNGNQLVGHVPKELGNLKSLQQLRIQNNHLTGLIPMELGNLSALSTFEYGNSGLKVFLRRGNKLAGGPILFVEGLHSWKVRMRLQQSLRQQKELQGDEKEEDAPVAPSSPPPVLLPQQQQPGEGDENDKDSPVPLGSPNRRQEVEWTWGSSMALPPVVGAAHNSELPSMADFAAMHAALEALTSANHRQQTKIEAMESDNKRLQRKVTALEKYVSKPDEERGEDVDVAAAAAAEHQPVTVSELREFEALQKEKHLEHEARFKELEGKISMATERKRTLGGIFTRGSVSFSRP